MLVLPAGDKVQVAAEIAERPARTLFFVRTKHGADRLARQFDRAGVAAAAIHGNLNQNQRPARWPASPPATRACWSPPTSRRAVSTWTTSSWSCTTTRRTTTRTTCTAPGAPPGPGADGMVVALVEEGQVRELERTAPVRGRPADPA